MPWERGKEWSGHENRWLQAGLQQGRKARQESTPSLIIVKALK